MIVYDVQNDGWFLSLLLLCKVISLIYFCKPPKKTQQLQPSGSYRAGKGCIGAKIKRRRQLQKIAPTQLVQPLTSGSGCGVSPQNKREATLLLPLQ
jgi:hypothetical protein